MGCVGQTAADIINVCALSREVPPTGRSFNGRTRGSGPRYRGSNPCLPAKSHFARQTTVRPAFASVSNVVITAQLTAGTGQAVHNVKASKNFLLPTSVRIPDSSCRVRPRNSQTADNGEHAVRYPLGSKARSGLPGLRTNRNAANRTAVGRQGVARHGEWRVGLRIVTTGPIAR